MLAALAETRHLASAPPAVAGWQARLRLSFEMRQGRTVLAGCSHVGPMRVQKALYHEGPQVCQAILVHPPGGVVGGDRLAIEAALGGGAHALVTTPGAGKWYRSAGPRAVQSVDVALGANAALEWLPQEAIVFDGAQAAINSRFVLADSARFIGWEIVCLGRTASGERYQSGMLRQSIEVVVGGRRRFAEYACVEGGSHALAARAGYQGYPVSGLMVAAGPDVRREVLARLRAVDPSAGAIGAVTTLPRVTLARCLAHSAEAAREYFFRLWSVLRPELCEREAQPPRIWSC
jgi:urease accessory protein